MEIDPGRIIELLLGGSVAVLAWITKRQVERIDLLEREKADKVDVEKSLAELKTDMREHRAESREGFRRVFERLDTIADRIK